MIGWLELTFISIAAIGLTHIVVDSTIWDTLVKRQIRDRALENPGTESEKRRPDRPFSNFLLDMMNCYMCFGFWAGLIVGLMYAMTFLPWMKWIFVILFGFTSSLTSMFAYYVFSYLDKGNK